MNKETLELAAVLGDFDMATELIAAGLGNLRKIEAARDAELERVVGVTGRKMLRERLLVLKEKA